MSKKKSSRSKTNHSQDEDPLAAIEEFRLEERAESSNKTAERPSRSTPISPLGPPQHIDKPSLHAGEAAPLSASFQQKIQSLEREVDLLKRTNKRLEKRNIELDTAVKLRKGLEKELEAERKSRIEAERLAAATDAKLQQFKETHTVLELERDRRIELEKKLASVEVHADRAKELAIKLLEERESRQKLETERATLMAQVENLKKTEQLLIEERQQRMNAQSHAATAEAQLARLEGERNSSGSPAGSSLIDRLRGKT